MKLIQETSRSLMWIFSGLLFLLPIYTIVLSLVMSGLIDQKWILLQPVFDPISTPEGLVNIASVTWTPFSTLILITADIISLIPKLLGLIILIRLFNRYARNEIFSIENASSYKHLGLLFFLNAFITQPLSATLTTLAVTLNNPAGHRWLTLSFTTTNLESIFIGFIITIIGWIMQRGAEMQEESRYTI